MKLNQEAIQRRLEQLAKRDLQRKVFGSAHHHYALNPRLDLDVVEAFEKRHNMALPEDYRYFITEIGNGGAGPAYGLLPFGRDDEGRWGAILPFGDPGQPFPHNNAWNLADDFWKGEPNIPEGTPQAEEDRIWNEWGKTLESNYWKASIMNGAIPICHRGCALRQWLVVHGEQRGYVWDDLRADHDGIAPVKDANNKPMTFADWYSAWLDEAERSARKQVSDAVSLFLLIVVGVVLGLIFAMP